MPNSLNFFVIEESRASICALQATQLQHSNGRCNKIRENMTFRVYFISADVMFSCRR